MENPILSIVITSYNSRELLAKCVESIKKSSPIHTKYEIIVSDNGSIDGSVELLKKRFPDVIVIENKENIGFSKAANRGILKSKGKYILILNSDTEVFQGALEEMIDYLEKHPDVGIAAPILVNPDGTFQPTTRKRLTRTDLVFGRRSLIILLPFFRKYSAARRIVPDDITEANFVSGGAMFLRRTAIEEVGLFDERFFLYMEDADLCRRMRQAGWKIIINPQIKILHHWEGTSSKLRRKAFLKHHISIYKYFQKYEPGFFRNLPLAIALTIHYILWWIYSFFEKNPAPKKIENEIWKR